MKVLVLSDTHGELDRAQQVLTVSKPYDYCFHLGDVGFDARELTDVSYVCGNHDAQQFVTERIIILNGWNTWIVHGHIFEFAFLEAMEKEPDLWKSWDACMEMMYDTIVSMARKKHCQLVLFGHTHTTFFEKRGGIYLCNPGSLCFSHDGRDPSYAILNIHKNHITCEHLFLHSEA